MWVEEAGAFLRWKTFELAAFADPNAISHGRSDKGAKKKNARSFFLSLVFFFHYFCFLFFFLQNKRVYFLWFFAEMESGNYII